MLSMNSSRNMFGLAVASSEAVDRLDFEFNSGTYIFVINCCNMIKLFWLNTPYSMYLGIVARACSASSGVGNFVCKLRRK